MTPQEQIKKLQAENNRIREACNGVPETLRQSADLLEEQDGDIDGECAGVREMARKLDEALA